MLASAFGHRDLGLGGAASGFLSLREIAGAHNLSLPCNKLQVRCMPTRRILAVNRDAAIAQPTTLCDRPIRSAAKACSRSLMRFAMCSRTLRIIDALLL
jgi:hypothetical protein